MRLLKVLPAGVAAIALVGCASSSAPPLESRLGTTGGRTAGEYGSQYKARARPGSPEQFKAEATDLVYFNSDSSELTPEAQQTLVAQTGWLKQYPSNTVTIEGHADERGTREYNIALGSRRATAVKTFLTTQGIPAARIRTISYGKERPVAVCDDISCWSKNRRAQTLINTVVTSSR